MRPILMALVLFSLLSFSAPPAANAGGLLVGPLARGLIRDSLVSRSLRRDRELDRLRDLQRLRDLDRLRDLRFRGRGCF